MRIVAKTKEWLWIINERFRRKIFHIRNLIIPPKSRDDPFNIFALERANEVGGFFFLGSAQFLGGRKLYWLKLENIRKPFQTQFIHVGPFTRGGKRGRKYGDLVASL